MLKSICAMVPLLFLKASYCLSNAAFKYLPCLEIKVMHAIINAIPQDPVATMSPMPAIERIGARAPSFKALSAFSEMSLILSRNFSGTWFQAALARLAPV